MIRHLLKLVWNRKRANALIMLEIFISFLVLVAVLTMAISTVGRWGQPLGFDYKDIWVIRMDFGRLDVQSAEAAATLDRVMRELKTFPQIESLAASGMPPYSNSVWEGVWIIDGKRVELTRDEATDDYAKVMHIPILRGRWFSAADEGASYEPVVIDTDLARAMYGNTDPIGRKFNEDKQEMRIIGVIPSYRKYGELSPPDVNMAFIRASLQGAKARAPRNVIVRVRPGTTAAFEETLTKRLHDLEPERGFRIARMENQRRLMNRVRMTPIVIGGIVALFLISMVTLGLTGVLWQNVTRRTREIGLRRALGASGSSVRGQVVAEVALLATIAVVLGIVILAQLPMLGVFHVVTPPMFAAGVLMALGVIYAITLLCGMYPGWLASRVPPAEALRYE
ncbi:MAG TPA: ABC transporter permease [Thermoanaerobaculia bacterium]|nr:ABC transporter permease [Thermoanaerobaculia bacterium]